MKYYIYELKRIWRMFCFYQWLANKLPKGLCYYTYIRVHAHATSTKYSHIHPDECNWGQALDCWGYKP